MQSNHRVTAVAVFASAIALFAIWRRRKRKRDPSSRREDDAIEKILRRHIPCGLYANEDRRAWGPFLARVEALVQVGGPRNDVQHAFGADAAAQRAVAALGLPSCVVGRPCINLPKIFRELEAYELHAFRTFVRLRERVARSTAALAELRAPASASRRKVVAQLARQKRPRPRPDGAPPAAHTRTIDDVVATKANELARGERELSALAARLRADPRWRRFDAAARAVAPYRARWDAVEKALGRDSNARGSRLEGAAAARVVGVVAARAGLDLSACTVLRNCDWNDGLGEVDIVIRQGALFVLVEVKARVFDVQIGSQQSGRERDPRKTHLRLEGRWTPVPRRGVRCFVATTLPEHRYRLPYESLVKRAITHRVKHGLSVDETWAYARGLIPAAPPRLSPLAWYREHRAEVILMQATS